MRKKEQRLWDTMKRQLHSKFWLRRIENDVGVGEADVWLGISGYQTWIELKAIILPKKETTRAMGNEGLSTAQINWHLKMASLELDTFVLIRDNEENLYFLPGGLAETMNEMPRAELKANSLATNWPDIRKYLGLK